MARAHAKLAPVGSFKDDPVAIESGNGESCEGFTLAHPMERLCHRLLLGSGESVPLFLRLLFCLMRSPDGMETQARKDETGENQDIRNCADHKFRPTKKMDKLKRIAPACPQVTSS